MHPLVKAFHLLLLTLLIPLASPAQDSPVRKNILGITGSFPFCNNFRYYDYSRSRTAGKWGFGGLEAALYYKTPKHKISLNGGIIADTQPEDMAEHDGDYVHTRIWCTVIELLYHQTIWERNNRFFNQLNFVGGMNFINYAFSVKGDSVSSHTKSDRTLGINQGAELRVVDQCYLTIFYRPAITHTNGGMYKHLLSATLRYDLDFRKR